MATYYVDPAAVGTNTGASWANAWTTLQSAFDTATAGDTVYMRGTQTLAVSLDIDSNSGAVNNRVSYIGCNSSGVEDGTRFVIDGNNAAVSCIDVAGARNYFTFKNIECKRATGAGFNWQTGTTIKHGWLVYNCKSHLNGGAGFAGSPDFQDGIFGMCYSLSNTGVGFSADITSSVCDSMAINNGAGGIDGPLAVIGCISHNNTTFGIQGTTTTAVPILVSHNNIIDGNSTGIITPTGGNSTLYLISCRLTNNTLGIAGDADCSIIEANTNYYNNATNLDATSLARLACSFGRTTGGSDPYIDRTNDNFNLIRNALGIKTVMRIGGLDSINIGYFTQGIPSDLGNLMTHPGMGGGLRG